jgi:hypothetical protein
MNGKTFGNTKGDDVKKAVRDVQFFGNPDQWKLLCKASSEAEGWMKSTKAMEVEGLGCLVQVTTQQGGAVAESVTWVPGVKVEDIVADSGSEDHEPRVVGRKLSPMILEAELTTRKRTLK